MTPRKVRRKFGDSVAKTRSPFTLAEVVRLLHTDGGVVEARILHTRRGTVSGYFDDPDKLAQAVALWDGTASIYVTLNSIRPDLLARSNNRLKEFAHVTTRDEEIIIRRWFFLDIDPHRPVGISATDDELADALALRNQVVDYLRHKGDFPEPICAMSGNGGHALWRVDLPNTVEILELYKRALKALGQKFSGPSAKVDESVFNAARHCKLYGTIAVKGDSIPGRPHRRSEIQVVPESTDLVTLDQLRWLADQYRPRKTYAEPLLSGKVDPIHIFQSRGLYRQSLPGNKHAVVCPWSVEHTIDHGPHDTSTVIFEPSDDREWGFKCLHDHCADRTLRDVLKHFRLPTADSFLPPKGGVRQEKNFNPQSAAELLSRKPEPITWIWDRFLPKGTVDLLVAYMKVGKSTFAYALAVAVARGKEFLGYLTKQGGVLILAVEEHPRDVKLRLHSFGMWRKDAIWVHAAPLIHSQNTLEDIQNFIIKNGIVLLIVDTLAAYWDIRDENDNAEVNRRVAPFQHLARETGCVVLLVHHERKSGGDEGRAIRGGSALLGIADQALMLERRQGGRSTERVLRTLGRYSETPRELVIEWGVDRYVSRGTPEEASGEAFRKKVLEELSAKKPKTVKDLIKATGLKDKQVRQALKALEDGDKVIREGKGVRAGGYTYRRQI